MYFLFLDIQCRFRVDDDFEGLGPPGEILQCLICYPVNLPLQNLVFNDVALASLLCKIIAYVMRRTTAAAMRTLFKN